ncbi:hypothetical protein [Streptoalloteichus tenebrarius]|uniref:hypothetical protein n=1 Tax=Streptoalloteichus tenebrarius (strain ATCC 17920 / DSM 40477 / JCM 4838 / CBS 697.72 / NBRC 16177 / NCIMB 11028 / NRRL B-12390 / A12253. 1 / ISP 5477) TaxID=1933 RepID=UPI0020A56DF3|nr:hypothetical protein [Streptoalloteichus tenebrarius]BFF04092.1 hypothetical protein GCM10020241_57670 [Streptoalloteichus tenebrarius]
MPTTPDIVDQWLALPREALVDEVRQIVKRNDAQAMRTFAAVRKDAVLSAKVRGALSVVLAEARGTRDEVMWTMWVNKARRALDVTDVGRDEVPAAPVATEPPVAEAEEPREIHLRQERRGARPPAAASVPPVVFRAPGQ